MHTCGTSIAAQMWPLWRSAIRSTASPGTAVKTAVQLLEFPHNRHRFVLDACQRRYLPWKMRLCTTVSPQTSEVHTSWKRVRFSFVVEARKHATCASPPLANAETRCPWGYHVLCWGEPAVAICWHSLSLSRVSQSHAAQRERTGPRNSGRMGEYRIVPTARSSTSRFAVSSGDDIYI